jgi:hypothetical protein
VANEGIFFVNIQPPAILFFFEKNGRVKAIAKFPSFLDAWVM